MYALGAEAHPPKALNFLPELNTLHRLLRATLAPKIGDSSTCPQFKWNLIQFYVQKKQFLVFDYMLQEIISISGTTLHSCGYAPQIMMLIEKVSEIEFLKDHEITDLKPQFPAALIITKDVPSTSAPQPPPSTHFGTTAPAPACSSSSSSSSVLWVLKSMFALYHDTHQRQDMLISNQRHLTDRMGVDMFNGFPLPVPPLDDDPLATLFATYRTAMEVDDDDVEGRSDSEYEEDEEEEECDDDYYNE
jgi:hypothetical protein